MIKVAFRTPTRQIEEMCACAVAVLLAALLNISLRTERLRRAPDRLRRSAHRAVSATGVRHRIAVELAVEDLDHDGAVLRRPVRLIVADDVCRRRPAESGSAPAGRGSSSVRGRPSMLPLLAAGGHVLRSRGIPMMSTTSSHPRLAEEGRRNVFRLIGVTTSRGRIAGNFWPSVGGTDRSRSSPSQRLPGRAPHRQVHNAPRKWSKEVLYLTYAPGRPTTRGSSSSSTRVPRNVYIAGMDRCGAGSCARHVSAVMISADWRACTRYGRVLEHRRSRSEGIVSPAGRIGWGRGSAGLRELPARGLGQHPTALPVTLVEILARNRFAGSEP